MSESVQPLHVVAIDDGTDYGATAMLFGEMLAPIFHAEFLVEKVEKIIDKKQFFKQADQNSVLMVVIGVADHKGKAFFTVKKALSFIKNEKIPVMVVGNKPPVVNAFKAILVPIDVERKAKEMAMWASYFNRFYDASIHIMRTIYKEDFLQNKVDDNINFIEKLYNNLNITYQIHQFDHTIPNLEDYSLQFAKEVDASLTIIMMTKYLSFIDILFGAKEKSLLLEAKGYPILCLNERDDLCVLCT